MASSFLLLPVNPYWLPLDMTYPIPDINCHRLPEVALLELLQSDRCALVTTTTWGVMALLKCRLNLVHRPQHQSRRTTRFPFVVQITT